MTSSSSDEREILAEAVTDEASGAGVTTEVLTSTDAEGAVIGYTQITTIKDAAGNSYKTTAVFDAGGLMLQSSYSDSLGYSSSTEYQVVTASDGAVIGYTQTSTSTDSSGYSYGSTVELDASGNVNRSSYADNAGNSSTTEYQFATGSDGASAGYAQTSGTDAAGRTYDSTVTYDASGRVIESSYADSEGNSNFTEYRTVTNDDGTVAGYVQSFTSTDPSGNSSTSTTAYDVNGTVTGSTYVDSSGNRNSTEYQTQTDAAGTVTGYIHTATTEDAGGNISTATTVYDATGNLLRSSFADSAGNSSTTELQVNTDTDGQSLGYTQITTTQDSSGRTSASSITYGANNSITEVSYTDSSGYSSVTEYQITADADGAVTGSIQTTTARDGSGYSYTSTVTLDASGNVVQSSYTDTMALVSEWMGSYEAFSWPEESTTDASDAAYGFSQPPTEESYAARSLSVYDAEAFSLDTYTAGPVSDHNDHHHGAVFFL